MTSTKAMNPAHIGAVAKDSMECIWGPWGGVARRAVWRWRGVARSVWRPRRGASAGSQPQHQDARPYTSGDAKAFKL